MNILKYFPLILAAMSLNAHAETIEAELLTDSSTLELGSATPYCKKVVFLTRNTGTLITGITESNLNLLTASHSFIGPPTYTNQHSPITISFTIDSTTQRGLYNLCITPIGFTWTNGGTDNYNFSFIINGTKAADHGVISIDTLG